MQSQGQNYNGYPTEVQSQKSFDQTEKVPISLHHDEYPHHEQSKELLREFMRADTLQPNIIMKKISEPIVDRSMDDEQTEDGHKRTITDNDELQDTNPY